MGRKFNLSNRVRLFLTLSAVSVLALVGALLPLSNAKAAPAFVQVNSATPQTNQSSVTVNFTSAQTAGNTNVIAIGFNDATSTISSVTDSKGNTYAVAAALARGSSLSQAVYYAKNIASATAGSNTLTVTFSGSVPYADIRVAEYSGLDSTSPVDVTASASGSATTANSGNVTTTSANELIYGAGMTGGGFSSTPINGFTTRVLTQPDTDIAIDKNVTSTGTYSATATVSGSWLMQAVGFKAANTSGDTTAPTVPTGLSATATSPSQINLSWTASTDSVGVTGYKIFRDGSQINTATGTTFSDTGLTPSHSYSYTVLAYDAAGNNSAQSSSASATTQADATAPSVPSSVTGTPAITSVALSWTASTDNVAVANYKVYRDGGATAVGSPTGTSFTDTGLTASHTYSYQVSAVDTAGNESNKSTSINVTTNATLSFAYPTSTSNRKFKDQNGQVINLKTFSSWAIAQNATNTEITSALEGVQGLGFNAVTVNPNGSNYGADWDRYHNISGNPFFTGTPFASSLGSGWSSMDWVMSEATRLHMTVVFSIYTGSGSQGMSQDLINAGTTNAYNYGHNLATRYADYPNIVWHIGADSGWNYGENPSSMVEAVMHGISDVEGSTHRLQIAEPLNGSTSYTQFISQEGTGGSGYQYLKLNANSVYSYGGSAADQFDSVYTQTGATTYPVWDAEPPYVLAPHYSGNKDQQTRERDYSTYIRGGVGINFGDEKWWPFGKSGIYAGGSGWLNELTTAPEVQAGYTNTLVDTYIKDNSWVPDNNSTFLKTGLGSGDTRAASGYSNTAGVVYFPSNRTVAVSTSGLPGTGNVRLRWLDPTAGTYSTIASSEARSTSRSVTYPSNHSDGTSDYVLVVDPAAPDTQAPSAPTNLSATAVSQSQINLSWTASTDNVGVTGYKIFRGGTQVGTSSTTSYSDTSLSAGTSYTYTVKATDAAGNDSLASSSASATTQSPDTQAPTAPTNLAAGTTTSTTVPLTWTASTDDVGVTGYRIYRDGGATAVGSPTGTSFTDTGLTASHTYSYTVKAIDAAGNLSAASSAVNATTSSSASYATPTFKQSNYATPQTSQSSVTVNYTSAQTAGDTNILAIGFNNATSTISSVTDSKGNTYTAAAALARGSSFSQAIYYAKNITSATAGSNTITVTFSGAVPYADIRAAEYSGLDATSPVDVTASASGTATTANSGNLTTTVSNELIFGAGITDFGFSSTAINGYTMRIYTQPDTDVAIDKNVTSTGTYSATATMDGGAWLMQAVGFKAAQL
jgi:chitodextrinase